MVHQLRWPKLLLAIVLAAASGARPSWAVEPVDAFLTALRQRQLFDESIDYLRVLSANPHVDDSVKQRVLYEEGMTVLASAAGLSSLEARVAQLSKAGDLFGEFLKHFPQHEMAASAQSQLANILIEHGRVDIESARQPGGKPSSLTAARDRFVQAKEQFDAAEKQLEGRLQKLPKFVAETDKPLKAQKRQIAGDLAQVRLLRASTDYELAKSYAPADAEAKKHLKTAAAGYGKLYESYRTRAAGLLARLWEGICYQEMGDVSRALGCFQELIDLPTTAETRAIKTKSTRHALECWTRDSEKKYQEAVERGERWEKEFGSASTDADALAIRYLTALAFQAQSSELPAKDPNRKKLAGFARQYVVPVAKHPGEYQRPAKMLLVALGGTKDAKPGDGGTTFSEAFERAKQALERMQEAEASMKSVKPGDRAALKPFEQAKAKNTLEAREALQLALRLSDTKVSSEDLNSARYYLCFLAWDGGQYYDAAVLGEFLARRYPETLPGRQGARIALNAYVRLVSDAKEPDKPFEMAHVQRVAELIFKQWPGQEEADEAALTLLNFSAAQNQWDKAVEYLNKIPATSPRRGPAELRAGQTLWSAYLRRSQVPADERPPQAELDALRKRAQDVLSQGITRMADGNVEATLAAAVFAMAQIAVETNQPDKAIEWLEHPKIGPLTLVKAGSPAAARDPFAAETYKLALRAYIAVHPQQLKKAEEVMDALEKQVQRGGDAKAAENLTAIYISLGRELQQHLQDLRKKGQKKELDAVSKAFEVFLDRVTKREAGSSFASLNWVGETYYSLGSGYSDGAALLSPQVKGYFLKATTAYQKLLEVAEKDPRFKEKPDSLMGIRLRLADCYAKSGKFDEAIKVIVDILHERPTLLTAQIQGAETYQAQGLVDANAYAKAILGAVPLKDGTHTIWGWSKLSNALSKVAATDPKYEEAFHKARLSMADARYQFAMTKEDKPARTKILDAARQDLWLTYKLHPDLGGEATKARYDRLLKLVQKSLGAKENGLEGFKQRDAAGATTSAK